MTEGGSQSSENFDLEAFIYNNFCKNREDQHAAKVPRRE
jgi:hypothetical protein